MSINPVIFPEDSDVDDDDEYLFILASQLDEFYWKNFVVGFEEKGVYVVKERLHKAGYYEYPAELITWEKISSVRIKRHISLKSLIGGIFMFTIGTLALMSRLSYLEMNLPIWFPVVMIVVGGFLIFGLVRYKLEVFSENKPYHFISSPFKKEWFKDVMKKFIKIYPSKKAPVEQTIFS